MFYGFDVVRMSKCLLGRLLFSNIGKEIPTYVRNDNSTVVYRVDSSNTVTFGARLNGFSKVIEKNWGRNNWPGIGYIPGEDKYSQWVNKIDAECYPKKTHKWKYLPNRYLGAKGD